jgi:hypothetical protein
VERKEESFFENLYLNSGKNIFLLIKDKNHPEFRSNKEILKLLYFNLDSIVIISLSQKQKFQAEYLDHISSFARVLVKGIIPAKLP